MEHVTYDRAYAEQAKPSTPDKSAERKQSDLLIVRNFFLSIIVAMLLTPMLVAGTGGTSVNNISFAVDRRLGDVSRSPSFVNSRHKVGDTEYACGVVGRQNDNRIIEKAPMFVVTLKGVIRGISDISVTGDIGFEALYKFACGSESVM